MRYAKHIGRVGGLAVALGVGLGFGPVNGIPLVHATEPSSESSSTDGSTTKDNTSIPRDLPPQARRPRRMAHLPGERQVVEPEVPLQVVRPEVPVQAIRRAQPVAMLPPMRTRIRRPASATAPRAQSIPGMRPRRPRVTKRHRPLALPAKPLVAAPAIPLLPTARRQVAARRRPKSPAAAAREALTAIQSRRVSRPPARTPAKAIRPAAKTSRPTPVHSTTDPRRRPCRRFRRSPTSRSSRQRRPRRLSRS